MPTSKTPTNEPADENASASTQRRDGWRFGPPNPFSEDEAAWWKRHEPTVDRWLTAMEEVNDPWCQAAEHAADCLVASRELDFTWDGFSVPSFLFGDLWEGGTVGIFGSAEKFFDHLVGALEHFVADGIIEPSTGGRWLAEMGARREAFVRCYDEATPERDAIAIARRHRARS